MKKFILQKFALEVYAQDIIGENILLTRNKQEARVFEFPSQDYADGFCDCLLKTSSEAHVAVEFVNAEPEKGVMVINGEHFNYSNINPDEMETGNVRLYLFWGTDWKKLDRIPKWNTIATIQMDGRYYNAKVVKELNTRAGYWHISHAGIWYEMSLVR